MLKTHKHALKQNFSLLKTHTQANKQYANHEIQRHELITEFTPPRLHLWDTSNGKADLIQY